MIYVLEDQGSRPYMEDRHYIQKTFIGEYDLMCIFDGHGNDNVAKLCHLYFKDILRNEIFNRDFSIHAQIADALRGAFQKMSDVIPKDIGMMSGSTALVILKSPQHIWIANSGDCRAVLVKEEISVPISIDHKPNLKTEYERITRVGGFVSMDDYGIPRVNGNLAVSRSFGDFNLSPMVTFLPDIFYSQVPPDFKYIFLASDGIFDAIKTEEINPLLKSCIDSDDQECIRTSCHNILHLARSRGSGDNITLIVSK